MTTHALMTQTLPTIVGAGVVSRTTDTMFRGKRGKSGRKSTGRAILVKKTRRFNGKVYRLANIHTSKAVAERDARYFRRQGHLARVVHTGGKWVVYVR